MFFEHLEPRVVLNATAITNADPLVDPPEDSAAIIVTSDNTLLDTLDPTDLQVTPPTGPAAGPVYDSEGNLIGIRLPDGTVVLPPPIEPSPNMTRLPEVDDTFDPTMAPDGIFDAFVDPIVATGPMLPLSTVPIFPGEIPGPPTANLTPSISNPPAPTVQNLLDALLGIPIGLPLGDDASGGLTFTPDITMPSTGMLLDNLNAGTLPLPTGATLNLNLEIVFGPVTTPLPTFNNAPPPWDEGLEPPDPSNALQDFLDSVLNDILNQIIDPTTEAPDPFAPTP